MAMPTQRSTRPKAQRMEPIPQEQPSAQDTSLHDLELKKALELAALSVCSAFLFNATFLTGYQARAEKLDLGSQSRRPIMDTQPRTSLTKPSSPVPARSSLERSSVDAPPLEQAHADDDEGHEDKPLTTLPSINRQRMAERLPDTIKWDRSANAPAKAPSKSKLVCCDIRAHDH